MLIRLAPTGPDVALPSFPHVAASVNDGNLAIIDWSKGNQQQLVIDANCSIRSDGLPSGENASLELMIVQGGAGSKVPFFLNCFTPGGTPLTFSTAAGARDIVKLSWDGHFLYAFPPFLNFS